MGSLLLNFLSGDGCEFRDSRDDVLLLPESGDVWPLLLTIPVVVEAETRDGRYTELSHKLRS